jgi:hypothetical protein
VAQQTTDAHLVSSDGGSCFESGLGQHPLTDGQMAGRICRLGVAAFTHGASPQK